MSAVTKVVWKEKPNCTTNGEMEDTLTMTKGEVLFKRVASKTNSADAKCPFSRVNESWAVKVASPRYADSFKELSDMAITMIANKDNNESIFGNSLQTLAIYYEDGSQEKVCRRGSIFEWEALRSLLNRFLPDLMVEAIFGDEFTEEAMVC